MRKFAAWTVLVGLILLLLSGLGVMNYYAWTTQVMGLRIFTFFFDLFAFVGGATVVAAVLTKVVQWAWETVTE